MRWTLFNDSPATLRPHRSRAKPDPLHPVLDSLSEFVADESALPSALSSLARAVGAAGAALVRTHPQTMASTAVACSPGLEPVVSSYDSRLDAANPMYRLALRTDALGTAIFDDDLVGRRDLHRSTYYNDFLRPAGLENTVGLFLQADASSVLNISLCRLRAHGTFRPAQRRLLRELTPHLVRAFRLREQIGHARVAEDATWHLLDAVPWGVLVFDSHARCIHINAGAEAVMARHDGLFWRNAMLACARSSDTMALRAAFERALRRSAHTPDDGSDTVIRVARTSGQPNYLARVMSIPASGYARSEHCPSVVVTITDPSRHPEFSTELLQQAFGLTPAEARIAVEIGNGRSIKECSTEQQCSVNTTKTLLNRVYAKTGARRQSELVGLLLRSFLPGRRL